MAWLLLILQAVTVTVSEIFSSWEFTESQFQTQKNKLI